MNRGSFGSRRIESRLLSRRLSRRYASADDLPAAQPSLEGVMAFVPDANAMYRCRMRCPGTWEWERVIADAGLEFRNNVGSGQAQTGTSVSATFAETTVSGSLLVGVVNCENSGSVTITPPSGWSTAATATSATATKTAILYRSNAPAVSTALTVTFSGSSLSSTFVVAEFAGVALTSALDQTATNTGTSTSPSSGTSGTTTQDVELLIVGLGSRGLSTFSAPTNGFELGVQIAENVDFEIASCALLWKLVTAAGTYDAGATTDLNVAWAGAIATFKAA